MDSFPQVIVVADFRPVKTSCVNTVMGARHPFGTAVQPRDNRALRVGTPFDGLLSWPIIAGQISCQRAYSARALTRLKRSHASGTKWCSNAAKLTPIIGMGRDRWLAIRCHASATPRFILRPTDGQLRLAAARYTGPATSARPMYRYSRGAAASQGQRHRIAEVLL